MFTLYEVTSHRDVEIKNEHTVKEVFCVESTQSMILSNWFYRLHGNGLMNSFMESSYFIQIDGEDLLDLMSCLELILNEKSDIDKKLLSSHYFPLVYVMRGNTEGKGMWSEHYYTDLKNIYDDLKVILPSNSVENRERLFLYNIS